MPDVRDRLAKLPPDRKYYEPSGLFSYITVKGPRRNENQDCAAAWGGPDGIAILLTDGMGGTRFGKDASLTATAELISRIDPQNLRIEDIERAVQHAHATCNTQFRGDGGTTAVGCVLTPKTLFVFWVGDSRAYGVAANGTVHLLTRDDTLTAWRQPNYAEDMEADPNSPLIQAIGCANGSLVPHVIQFPSDLFRRVILATDGAYRIPADAFNTGAVSPDPTRAISHSAEWYYGKDNISVATLNPSAFPKGNFCV